MTLDPPDVVPHPVDVVPHVADQRSKGVAHMGLAAVILRIGPALAAEPVRGAQVVELAVLGLAVVQDAVVGGLEGLAQRLAAGIPGDPVLEIGPLGQQRDRMDEQPRDVVDEDAAGGLEDAQGLAEPLVGPLQVFLERQLVLVGAVFLAQVERRVGEDHIDGVVADRGHHVQAVDVEHRVGLERHGRPRRRHSLAQAAGGAGRVAKVRLPEGRRGTRQRREGVVWTSPGAGVG